MSEHICIGIDLGTSHSVVALHDKDETPEIVDVTQIAGQNSLQELPVLPSALYIPHKEEFPKGSITLPWSKNDSSVILGEFAREHGAMLPDRLITSSKSWLCNNQVDRSEKILPWGSEIEEDKFSPIDVSSRILAHLRQAVTQRCSKKELEQSSVVITVPASFDEIARQLTHDAAEKAGLKGAVLLEEPLAAFYSWISTNEEAWRDQVSSGDVVLVCDLGGGTADFSIISVIEGEKGMLELERISVGDHILLGGDNMDLAIAYAIRGKLAEEDEVELDDWQFLSVIHQARLAKERLLSDEELEEFPISIPSRGSSLFAQTISTSIARETVLGILLDGFFPILEQSERPEADKGLGLQEFGLAYASDPALSKHLAAFLAKSITTVRSSEHLQSIVPEDLFSKDKEILIPNAVLFNGGVFRSELIRKRVLEILETWNDKEDPIRELQGADLDLAVARGAAYYGREVRQGEGVKIRSGTARSYYLGLETSMPAVPGYTPPVKGLCVIPQGTEEGSELVYDEKEFGLKTGEKVQFRFYSASTRAGDEPGHIVGNATKHLEELPQLEMEIEQVEDAEEQVVPVNLHAVVTELGMLELWMHHTNSEQKWKLEFNLRGTE